MEHNTDLFNVVLQDPMNVVQLEVIAKFFLNKKIRFEIQFQNDGKVFYKSSDYNPPKKSKSVPKRGKDAASDDVRNAH
jgi:hypothetical protein